MTNMAATLIWRQFCIENMGGINYTIKNDEGRHVKMQMVKLVCPYCGATLSIENGIDSFYCTYCGGKILLQGQDKNAIEAKVKLKEFEHKERLQHDQYDYQERLQKSKQEQEYELKKLEAKKERTSAIVGMFMMFMIFLFAILFILFRK